MQSKTQQITDGITIHYSAIYNDMFRPYKWAIIRLLVEPMHCNLYYVVIPSVNCVSD